MRCHDITGQTKLDEVIDIIGICDYFLSNDSGLMHIAASLSIKQESFFGSSDPSNTPPLNKNSVINYLNIECSPCFERNCPLEHFKCMKLIDENKVLERILWSTKK
jgi:heptosyltransferase-2